MESVLAPVDLCTVPHNTRSSSAAQQKRTGSSAVTNNWNSPSFLGMDMVLAGHSKATNPAPGCPIALALTFLLTGTDFEEVSHGNFGCQPCCVSVKGVLFLCTQTMAGWKQAGIWVWTTGFASFNT